MVSIEWTVNEKQKKIIDKLDRVPVSRFESKRSDLHSFHKNHFENMLRRWIRLAQRYVDGFIQTGRQLIRQSIGIVRTTVAAIEWHVNIRKHTMNMHACLRSRRISTKYTKYWNLRTYEKQNKHIKQMNETHTHTHSQTKNHQFSMNENKQLFCYDLYVR